MPEIAVTFPPDLNEQGRPMIWFGCWLVGREGHEGAWFHSARGGAVVRARVPRDATGLRIRRWPSDGLDAEYADLLALDGITAVEAAALDFDSRQEHSLLPAAGGR